MIRKLLFIVGLLALSVIAFQFANSESDSEQNRAENRSESANQAADEIISTELSNESLASESLASESMTHEFQSSAPSSKIALASYTSDLDGDSNQATNSGNRLKEAARLLEHGRPIQAKLRYKIDLFGQELTGPGLYVQEGQGGSRWRMELHHNSQNSKLRLAQVCDGRIFFRLQELDDEPELSFVDLSKLPASVRAGNTSVENWSNPWSSIGGIPSAMKHIATHFDFQPIENAKLGDIDVIKLTGQWKPSSMSRMFPISTEMNSGRSPSYAALRKLPPHVPHAVQLFLGTKNDRFPLFPYRIIFYRHELVNETKEGSSTTKLKPIVVMEFFNLKNVERFDDSIFKVKSPAAGSTDLTEEYIHQANRLKQLK